MKEKLALWQNFAKDEPSQFMYLKGFRQGDLASAITLVSECLPVAEAFGFREPEDLLEQLLAIRERLQIVYGLGNSRLLQVGAVVRASRALWAAMLILRAARLWQADLRHTLVAAALIDSNVNVTSTSQVEEPAAYKVFRVGADDDEGRARLLKQATKIIEGESLEP